MNRAPLNATTPEEVAMSLRAETLTIVYEEEGANGEKHYAVVPVSSKYKETLDNACECFEEYFPENWESFIIELQHEVREGHWAVIHPSVFSRITSNVCLREIKLRIRPARNRNRSAGGSNVSSPIDPSPSIIDQRSTYAAAVPDPPPYTSVAVPPQNIVLDNPDLPISNHRHEAYCDRCRHKIFGVRYKCITCDDYDLCAVCVGFAPIEHGHRFQAIINGRTRLYRPMDEWRMGEETQPSAGGQHQARCDICGLNPIQGTRFKCAVCPDWDTCGGCLGRSATEHPDHMFIRVVDDTVLIRRSTREPTSMPTLLQCNICQQRIPGPKFYQCSNIRCPRKNICINCEALPLSSICAHPLMRRFV